MEYEQPWAPTAASAREAAVRTYMEGERLCDAGDEADVFFVVLAGTLQEEGAGARLAPGDVVDYDAFCLSSKRRRAVVAGGSRVGARVRR